VNNEIKFVVILDISLPFFIRGFLHIVFSFRRTGEASTLVNYYLVIGVLVIVGY